MKIQGLVALAAAMVAVQAQAAVLNEIRVDETGTDDDEFFEIAGTSGESLNGLSLVVIGDGAGGSGTVERVYSLEGLTIPADGYFLAAGASDMPGFTGESVDLVLSPATNIFENSDTLTFLLVSGNTTTAGTDLDTDDNGAFDASWYTSLLDSVAILDDVSELPYSSTQVPANGTFPYAQIYRVPNSTGDWQYDAAGFSDYSNDTPGTANPIPEPASSALLGLGGLAVMSRRRRA